MDQVQCQDGQGTQGQAGAPRLWLSQPDVFPQGKLLSHCMLMPYFISIRNWSSSSLGSMMMPRKAFLKPRTQCSLSCRAALRGLLREWLAPTLLCGCRRSQSASRQMRAPSPFSTSLAKASSVLLNNSVESSVCHVGCSLLNYSCKKRCAKCEQQ